jgi:hypothetical protein
MVRYNQLMAKSWRVLLWAAAVLFLFLFVLASWPTPIRRFEIRITSPASDLIQVARDAVIEIPGYIWQGETGTVRLTVLAQPVDSPGTSGVILETALDFPVELTGGDTKWEALVPGQQASFTWGVRGGSPGLVQGKLWVWANSGDEREALLARPVEINVRTFGGLQVGFVRWSAAVIALLCLLAGFGFQKTVTAQVNGRKF